MESLQKILNQFDIPEIYPVKMIRESQDNQVYLIGSKDKNPMLEVEVTTAIMRRFFEDVHIRVATEPADKTANELAIDDGDTASAARAAHHD